MNPNLAGIIPPLPTSFHENEDLNPEKIRENIHQLLQYELRGILVLGSNGELVMLSEKEKEQVFMVARESIPDDKLMIAGCGGQSTRETINLTKMAARCGADLALVLNPFYYKGLMTKEVLVHHYHEVADSSDIPLLIYNMPGNSGMDMNAETLLAIAEHPNIIGLKDSGGDIKKIEEVILNAADDFQVLAGGAGFLLPALQAGAVGGILALANIRAQKCLDLLTAFSLGDLKKADDIQQDIIPLNLTITRKWGVPALKAAMDYIGLYGGPARRPLMPLDPDRKKELIELL